MLSRLRKTTGFSGLQRSLLYTSLLAAELRHQARVSGAHSMGTGCIPRGADMVTRHVHGVTGEPWCAQDAVRSLTCTFSSGTCPGFGAPPPGLLITPCWSRWTEVLPPSPCSPSPPRPGAGRWPLVFFLSCVVPLCHLEGQPSWACHCAPVSALSVMAPRLLSTPLSACALTQAAA